MNEKRIQILDSAIRFFSEKGYFHTSMQEIASDCGISKGSLYKIVDSKEDLLIQVFEYNHEKMFQRARTVQLDEALPRKSMLKKLIVIELEGTFENKDFFNIIYRSLPGEDNKKIFAVMKRTRAAMVNWHKHILLHVYGDKVEKRIWDLVITFQGIIKEFIFLISREGKQLDFEQVACYIANLLDTIVHHLPEKDPVLTNRLMEDYQSESFMDGGMTKQDQAVKVLHAVKASIESADFDRVYKQDLLASVEMLEEEIKAPQSRTFLVKALLDYLRKTGHTNREVTQVGTLLSEQNFFNDEKRKR